MSYQQVHEILDRIRSAHRRMRDELERARSGADDDRTRRVLEALRQDEQAMNLALGQYQRQDGASPLSTWIQYVPDEETGRLLDEARFTEHMDPDDVLELKVEIDRSLVDLYRRLSEQSSASRVNELFDSLAEQTSQRLVDEVWRARDSESAPKSQRDSPP